MKISQGLLRFVVSAGFLIGTCGILQAQTLSTLANFGGSNGSVPNGTLMQADDGNFYGTTQQGGANGLGTIFRMTPSGVVTVVHSFTGTDGEYPTSGLIEGIDGLLYGVTFGGPSSNGTIFTLSLSGNFTNLATLTNAGPENPMSPLIQDTDGTLYGVAQFVGGVNTGGAIYKVTPAGVVSVVYAFSENGKSILPSSIVKASDGYLYGTTVYGGTSDAGMLFRVATDGSAFSILHSFTGTLGDGSPVGGIVEGASGVLYGVSGGILGLTSNIYQFVIGGSYSVLSNGWSLGSVGGLILGPDGNLYALSSGIEGILGGVFRISPTGIVTSLLNLGTILNTGNSLNPILNIGLLSVGLDGNLYGVSNAGGTGGLGFLFKINLGGTLIPPINLTFSEPTITLGNTINLVWQLENGLSETAATCAAHGAWTGIIPASGTSSITPTSAGTAIYSIVCAGIELGSTTLNVGKANSTTTVQSGTTSLQSGQTASFTMQVSGVNGAPSPTGTVTLNYKGQTVASGSLNSNGEVTLTHTTNGIPVGTYQLSVNYSGDLNYKASSTSETVQLNPANTVTSVTAPTSLIAGQTATLSSTVTRTDGIGTPGGSVTFRYESKVLGTANVNASGTATLTVTSAGIDANTYSVTAYYNGDAYDVASKSSTQTVVVERSTSTLQLQVSSTAITSGQSDTLTATVTREYASKEPTGNVVFYTGNYYLGSAPVNNGVATFTRSSQGAGARTYPVYAVWTGDTVSTGSTSNTVDVSVSR